MVSHEGTHPGGTAYVAEQGLNQIRVTWPRGA